ncbi:CHAT domain-containing protein [Glycomyces sp. NPDC048151]|uniref:CHAT domain-containing tetratricopeptide repeat protein n=1 Tax=Glycomyces sp. NPDC048151 TaxID=3364002 RepID=UPI0037207EA3
MQDRDYLASEIQQGEHYFRRYEARGKRKDLHRSARHYLQLFAFESYASAPLELYERVPAAVAELILESLFRPSYELLRASGISGDPAAQDLAVEVWRRLAAISGPWDPMYWRNRSDLGLALFNRFEASGDPADVDEAVEHMAAGLAASPDTNEFKPHLHGPLGVAMLRRYEYFHGMEDLDGAIEHLTVSVNTLPMRRSIEWGGARELANALELRSRLRGRPDDLDASIDLLREITETDDGPLRNAHLGLLAARVFSRYEAEGREADCDAVIELCRRVLASAPPDDPARPVTRFMLGSALLDHCQRDWIPALLDEALEMLREAAADSGLDLDTRGTARRELGRAEHLRDWHAQGTVPGSGPQDPFGALLSDYERALRFVDATGSDDAVDRAVRAGEAALGIMPEDHQRYAELVLGLAILLEKRFSRGGDVADIEAAVRYGTILVERSRADASARRSAEIALGKFHLARFERLSDLEALQHSVEHNRNAVSAAEGDRDGEAFARSNLAGALQSRYTVLGNRIDLDDAVAQLEFAQSTVGPGDHRHPDYCSNLGMVLRQRFEAMGDIEDLMASVRFGTEALEPGPATGSAFHMPRANLALTLMVVYQATGDSEGLDQAVELCREALADVSNQSAEYLWYQSNLAIALTCRYSAFADEGDLDEAVEHAAGAVSGMPESNPRRPSAVATLGGLYLLRYERHSHPRDLDQALAHLGAAVDGADPANPVRALRLDNLARAVARRWLGLEEAGEAAAAADYLSLAADCYSEILETTNAPVRRRITAGGNAGRLRADLDPERAARELLQAAMLLPEAAAWRLDWEQRLQVLSEFPGIAADAAAMLLETRGATAAGQAVRILEAGRAVLLNQAVAARGEVDRLAEYDPELSERFVAIGSVLNGSSGEGPFNLEAQGGLPHNLRHRLAEAHRRLVEEIRGIEGFADFMELPSLDAILAEAAAGPIVMLNASAYGSHALIVTTGGIDLLALDIEGEELTELVVGFHEATGALGSGRDLRPALRRLWQGIVAPVLDRLGIDEPPPVPQRLWWVPGGAFGSLPLHAAGPYPDGDSAAPVALDYVVSSLTPSIRQLHFARRRAAAGDRNGVMATVSMSTTPLLDAEAGDLGDLRFVKAEVDWIRERWDAPADRAFDDGAATFEAVTTAMRTSSFAHLACHGVSDRYDPAVSRLLLADHATRPLTVADLAALDLSDARFAYLSACGTARSLHGHLLDESLHLVAAFQAAGYAAVVGTLWSVNDRAAFEIAKKFYSRFGPGSDPASAAEALHAAVREVKSEFGLHSRPDLWGAWIHSGA